MSESIVYFCAEDCPSYSYCHKIEAWHKQYSTGWKDDGYCLYGNGWHWLENGFCPGTGPGDGYVDFHRELKFPFQAKKVSKRMDTDHWDMRSYNKWNINHIVEPLANYREVKVLHDLLGEFFNYVETPCHDADIAREKWEKVHQAWHEVNEIQKQNDAERKEIEEAYQAKVDGR